MIRTNKGVDAPPDGQQQPPPPTNNDVGNSSDSKNGVGGLGNSDGASAASSSAFDRGPGSARSHQEGHDDAGSDTGARRGGAGARIQVKETGLGDVEGGGAQADTTGYPRGPMSEGAQEVAMAMAVAPPAAGTGGGDNAVAGDRREAASAISSGRNTGNIASGASGDSGAAPIGGLLDRKKSVAAMLDRTKSHVAMVDRGNKKKPTPAVKHSSGTAVAHGAKKTGGSNNAGGKKHTRNSNSNSNSASAATDDHHQHEKGLGGEPSEVPAEAVEAIDLPKHVLTEDNCTFWVR